MPPGGGRVQLPIACTLDAEAGKDRLGRWAAILASHRIDRQLAGDVLLVRFRRDADAERELSVLVAAERDCCGFVGWHLETVADQLVLRVTGEPHELAALNFAG